MALTYDYVDPKKMSAFQLIEPGEGKFKIINVEEKNSRAGNPMMEVTMQLTNTKGQTTLAKEYLMANTTKKIYSILNAIGRAEAYGLPLETRHLLQGQGQCIIKTEKSDNPQYQDRSVVGQYIAVSDAMSQPSEVEFDDDIPF